MTMCSMRKITALRAHFHLRHGPLSSYKTCVILPRRKLHIADVLNLTLKEIWLIFQDFIPGFPCKAALTLSAQLSHVICTANSTCNTKIHNTIILLCVSQQLIYSIF